jgi:uncharacterized protein YoxC
MSTKHETPFGIYETYQGRIWSISPELKAFLGDDVNPKTQEELQRILAQRVKEARNSSERNKARMEKQMAELKDHADKAAKRAAEEAKRRADQRIAEAKHSMEVKLKESEKEMAGRIAGLREDTRRNLESLRRQQQKALRNLEDKVYDDMDRMHRQIDTRIDGLAHDMSVIQGDLLNRIAEVQSNVNLTNARLDSTNEHIDMVEAGLLDLTDYVGQMEEQINQRFSEQEEEIQYIQGEVAEIQHKMASIDIRGIERAKMAIALMDEVERNNDLDRFVPQEAQKVRRQMTALADMGATGAELSAAANAALLAVQELEIDCTRERLKYEQKEELTRTMLEAVLETVNNLREIQLTEDDGETPVSIENNFWSRGRYNTLKGHLQSLKDEIEQRGGKDMTIERLDEIQREVLKGEVDIREITSQSVAGVNLSQARMQAVSDIIEVMEEQQWEVIEKNGEEEIGYVGGEMPSDYREGFFARLRNELGEEVTVIVDPNDDDTNTLGFHFSSTEKELTDEQIDQKTTIVTEQIAQSGYQVEQPKCTTHAPMPEMESAESMSERGAAKRMRERRNH